MRSNFRSRFASSWDFGETLAEDVERADLFFEDFVRGPLDGSSAAETVPTFDVGAGHASTREFIEMPAVIEDWVANDAGTGLVMSQFPCETLAELTAVAPGAAARIAASAVTLWQTAGPKLKAAFEVLIFHPATTAGGTTLPPGRHPLAIICMGNHTAVRGGTEILSHKGYSGVMPSPPAQATGTYLQEALAARGIISASVNTNAANLINLKIETRARLIVAAIRKMQTLDRTRTRYRNHVDFDRVAIIGHSRGGDAAARALAIVPSGVRVRALVQIAPTDMTGLLQGAAPTGLPTPAGAPTRRFVTVPLTVTARRRVHQLLIWGSRDGDVSGFQDVRADVAVNPFRHYDRSSAQRAFQFWHGGTHNRFNRLWTDDEEDCIGMPNPCDPRKGLVRHHVTAGLMTRAQHEARTIEMVRGWLQLTLYDDTSQAGLFDGRTTTSVAASLRIGGMWKFGARLETIDQFDDLRADRNTMGGANLSPATGVFGELTVANENVAGAGITAYQFPHIDRALRFSPAPSTGVAAPRWRTTIPTSERDFRRFDVLTLRVTKKYDATKLDAGTATLPTVRVRLIGATAASAQVQPATGRLSQLPVLRKFSPAAPFDGTSVTDLTKVHYETWEVDLSPYPATLRRDVRFVELEIDTDVGEPVYVDTLSLVKRP
jgi:hypothetical protein